MMPRPPSPSLGGSLHWWRFFIMDPFFWTSRLLTFASGSDFYGMDGFISDKSWFSPLVDVKLFSMLDTVMYHVVVTHLRILDTDMYHVVAVASPLPA